MTTMDGAGQEVHPTWISLSLVLDHGGLIDCL